MEYGKLDYLAVSGTIDFSKLNDFNSSKFNTWKYRIDDNQLRLTFGTEIYGTEEHNVTGLVLEFYDLWGFVGSLEISNKSSYSGVFTKILNLNRANMLSKKKINKDTYHENFIHNVNICQESDGNFYYINKHFIIPFHTSRLWLSRRTIDRRIARVL